MHPNAQLIERFYTALGQRDSATMGACYLKAAFATAPRAAD